MLESLWSLMRIRYYRPNKFMNHGQCCGAPELEDGQDAMAAYILPIYTFYKQIYSCQ